MLLNGTTLLAVALAYFSCHVIDYVGELVNDVFSDERDDQAAKCSRLAKNFAFAPALVLGLWCGLTPLGIGLMVGAGLFAYRAVH